jgi:peroxiredoxin Q/BCP
VSGDAIGAFDVALFAASVDTAQDNKRFAEQLGVEFPVLSDPGRVAAKAYGVVRDDKSLATRWTFFIDADGKILHIDRQVSPSTHGRDIAAKLAELGVKKRGARRSK